MLPSHHILPQSHDLGQFHPHSLVLELTISSRAGLKASIDYERGSSNHPAQIFAHELCHWADVVGTVWGQEYLDDVFAALDRAALDQVNPVASYPAMLHLFDRDRAILFPSYYKVIDPAAQPTTAKSPWAITVSCGAWIDPMGRLDETRPIFFVRFDETLNGPLVARQPMTVGALLELRATAAEIATFDEWLGRQSHEDQMIANTLFRRERLATFYHPQLTTYSAAAHLLSFCTKVSDFATVCRSGASLVDLCLNVVPKAFSRLRPPKTFREFTPQRLGAFGRMRDRGYLFACLAYHAKEMEVTTINPETTAALLTWAGLGTHESIYEEAQRKFTQLMNQPPTLHNPDLRRIRAELIRMGAMILQWRRDPSSRACTAQDYLATELPSPVVMTNDGEEFHITSGLPTIDSDLLIKLDNRVRDLTRDALRAGRGLDFGFPDYVY